MVDSAVFSLGANLLTPKLMIPGPVTLEDDVLFQMGQQVQPHYGPEWTAIFNETLDLLKQVFETQGDVYILVGSGTAGIDASIASLQRPERLLWWVPTGILGTG